jgi:hypothetical protein
LPKWENLAIKSDYMKNIHLYNFFATYLNQV